MELLVDQDVGGPVGIAARDALQRSADEDFQAAGAGDSEDTGGYAEPMAASVSKAHPSEVILRSLAALLQDFIEGGIPVVLEFGKDLLASRSPELGCRDRARPLEECSGRSFDRAGVRAICRNLRQSQGRREERESGARFAPPNPEGAGEPVHRGLPPPGI